jgi:hypothetical protein|nr:MAG TPA: hypothetical protein [Caudoviricetes sp.]
MMNNANANKQPTNREIAQRLFADACKRETEALYTQLIEIIKDAANDCCMSLNIDWSADIDPYQGGERVEGGKRVEVVERCDSTREISIWDGYKYNQKRLIELLDKDGFTTWGYTHTQLGFVVDSIEWELPDRITKATKKALGLP